MTYHVITYHLGQGEGRGVLHRRAPGEESGMLPGGGFELYRL